MKILSFIYNIYWVKILNFVNQAVDRLFSEILNWLPKCLYSVGKERLLEF